VADLAEISDLTARLGRALTAEEAPRASTALDDASAAVVAYTRQAFVPQQEIIVRRLTDSWIKLIAPVVSVDLVEIPGNLQATSWIGVPYAFDGLDRVSAYTSSDIIVNLPVNANIARTVRITYTHGYVEVPADVVGVVCSAAIRQLQTPAISVGFGVQSEASGPFNRTYTPQAMTGAVYLAQSEMAVLDQYRTTARSFPVSTW
jgi:hypothetical protein